MVVIVGVIAMETMDLFVQALAVATDSAIVLVVMVLLDQVLEVVIELITAIDLSTLFVGCNSSVINHTELI